MVPEIIYEDDDVFAVHQPGDSPFSLVTFGSLTDRPDGTRFWGQDVAAKLGLDTIGILAKSENWYPVSAMRRAAPVITSRLRKRRVGYGYSMGGYGALKHGSLLGLTHAFAVSPQGSIRPEEVPEDRRFHRFFRPDQHASMRVTAEDLAPVAVQVVDPYEEDDRVQAELLAATGTIHTLRLPFMRHATIWHFASTPALRTALDLLLADDIPGLRQFLRRHRAVSSHWPLLVGQAALGHDHERVAEALWERAAAMGHHATTIRLQRAAGLEQLAKRLLRRKRPGDAERADACAMESAEIQAEDPAVQLRIGLMLNNRGRHAAAVPVLRRAAELNPEIPVVHLALSNALLRTGQREEALAAIREGARILPRDVAIARHLGHLLNGMRDLIGAEAAFRTVLGSVETEAERGQAALDLCHVLTAQTRFEEALAFADLATGLLPDDPRPRVLAGKLRLQTKDRVGAAAAFTAAGFARSRQAVLRWLRRWFTKGRQNKGRPGPGRGKRRPMPR